MSNMQIMCRVSTVVAVCLAGLPIFTPGWALAQQTGPDGLNVCLEKARQVAGEIDTGSPEVRACYKQWAGTVDSTINIFSVTRVKTGPSPCFRREIVTIQDNGTMTVDIVPNDRVPDCGLTIPSESRTYHINLMNIEYFRSLLGMPSLFKFKGDYTDPDMPETSGTKWTFSINGERTKTIRVNVLDPKTALPRNVRAFLTSFDGMIFQTQKN